MSKYQNIPRASEFFALCTLPIMVGEIKVVCCLFLGMLRLMFLILKVLFRCQFVITMKKIIARTLAVTMTLQIRSSPIKGIGCPTSIRISILMDVPTIPDQTPTAMFHCLCDLLRRIVGQKLVGWLRLISKREAVNLLRGVYVALPLLLQTFIHVVII